MVTKRPTTRKEHDAFFEARIRRIMEEDGVCRDVAIAYIAIRDTGSCADVFIIDENGRVLADTDGKLAERLQAQKNTRDNSE